MTCTVSTKSSLSGQVKPCTTSASHSGGYEQSYLLEYKKIGIVGGGVQLGPLSTAATNRPIVPAPGDHDDGEIGGMIGRGNRSTWRKHTPVPLYPPQIPHAARTRTRAAAVGSQRLAAWATVQPFCDTTTCGPLKDNRCFLWICRLHLQGRRIRQARNQNEADSKQSKVEKKWR
jgi:hypothetical protein